MGRINYSGKSVALLKSLAYCSWYPGNKRVDRCKLFSVCHRCFSNDFCYKKNECKQSGNRRCLISPKPFVMNKVKDMKEYLWRKYVLSN